MATDRGKLGNFLAEVIQWRWDEFVEAERSSKYTGFEATVLSLVRVTSEAKLGAIKLAIDRVDGKIETPVKIEYPKFWLVYPFAERVALPQPDDQPKIGTRPSSIKEEPPQVDESKEPEDEPVAVVSLRDTLLKLADAPRVTVDLILEMKKKVEEADGNIESGDMAENTIPMVKSVIAANLLRLANEKGNFEAITEVFDQIDGKLVETLRVIGDDVFLTQYALEAPYGAEKNKDGVYMIEAPTAASVWEEKIKAKTSGKR